MYIANLGEKLLIALAILSSFSFLLTIRPIGSSVVATASGTGVISNPKTRLKPAALLVVMGYKTQQRSAETVPFPAIEAVFEARPIRLCRF
ncbi:unnamed protein product [Ceratitis capitata]|uniref:(Mediterranean fruit fly) hypothetical protein n=1 Tax=Ceratitis capitata TaxID=7213 RepID=A0A811VHQ1_CERCA|nr:unnamed protein product [Ceratitis capitata]